MDGVHETDGSRRTGSEVKNPAADTAVRLIFESIFSVSFPQAKRVANPSGKIPDKPE